MSIEADMTIPSGPWLYRYFRIIKLNLNEFQPHLQGIFGRLVLYEPLFANETLYQLSYSPIPTLILLKAAICSRNRKNRKFIYFMSAYIFGFALTQDKHKLD